MDRIISNRRDEEMFVAADPIERLISLQLEELSLSGGTARQFTTVIRECPSDVEALHIPGLTVEQDHVPVVIEERASDVESLQFPGFTVEQRDEEAVNDYEDDSTELERFGGGLVTFHDDVNEVVESGGGLIQAPDMLDVADEIVDRFAYFDIGNDHQAAEDIDSDIDIAHENGYLEIENATTDEEVDTVDTVSDYGEAFESTSEDNGYDDYDSYDSYDYYNSDSD